MNQALKAQIQRSACTFTVVQVCMQRYVLCVCSKPVSLKQIENSACSVQ